MIYIYIPVQPYLAAYARAKYAHAGGGVVFPKESIILSAVVNRLQTKPREAEKNSGNMCIAIRESQWEKDLSAHNWLRKNAILHIERLLRLDFDMTLHEYMDTQYYRYGVDYMISVVEFKEKYHLGNTITEEALLKKHVRWKNARKRFRRQAEQGEIDFR